MRRQWGTRRGVRGEEGREERGITETREDGCQIMPGEMDEKARWKKTAVENGAWGGAALEVVLFRFILCSALLCLIEAGRLRRTSCHVSSSFFLFFAPPHAGSSAWLQHPRGPQWSSSLVIFIFFALRQIRRSACTERQCLFRSLIAFRLFLLQRARCTARSIIHALHEWRSWHHRYSGHFTVWAPSKSHKRSLLALGWHPHGPVDFFLLKMMDLHEAHDKPGQRSINSFSHSLKYSTFTQLYGN